MIRFETQGETQQHLEELKKEGEKHIARLREEKEKLQNEFEEMKYSGEAKLSRYKNLNTSDSMCVVIFLIAHKGNPIFKVSFIFAHNMQRLYSILLQQTETWENLHIISDVNINTCSVLCVSLHSQLSLTSNYSQYRLTQPLVIQPTYFSGGSRISCRGGANSRGGYVLKNLYVKTKESGPLGGGGVRAGGTPLDPPLYLIRPLIRHTPSATSI